MKSQATILFVITQGFLGGAQKYVLDLAAHLGAGYRVGIAVGQDERETFTQLIEKISPEITLYPLKHLKREISPLHDLLAIHELRSLYKKIQPDIVHLNSSKAGVLGSFAKTAHTKIVYTAHGWVFLEPLSPLRKASYRFLERISAPYKDMTIVLSESDATVAQHDLHIPKNKRITIPLGLSPLSILERDTARQNIAQYNIDIDRKKTWSITIANHYPTKGLDILIDAIAKMELSKRRSLQCIFIGDGPERNFLTQKIQTLSLEKTVFLLPFLPKAATYLSAADMFILPSRKEGLPYVLLEALQAGLPIIASSVGGIPTLLNNQNILVTPEDSDELKTAIETLLDRQSLWPQISEMNKKESRKYSLQTMIDTTVQLYQNFFSK